MIDWQVPRAALALVVCAHCRWCVDLPPSATAAPYPLQCILAGCWLVPLPVCCHLWHHAGCVGMTRREDFRMRYMLGHMTQLITESVISAESLAGKD